MSEAALKNVVVCMKQVLDPEIPLSLFRIDAETRIAIPPKATPPVLSPFDESALEAALQIKDAEETRVTVISLGRKFVRAVVTAPLAAGADQLVLLQDGAFDEFDTRLTASAIAAAIGKLEQYDLILCGLQAADTNSGQVGTSIAGLLGIPCITAARRVWMEGDTVVVERSLPDGYEVMEVPCPAVVTVTYEVGSLREPGVEAFMSAGQKPVTTWSTADLGIDLAGASRFEILTMETPVHEGRCEILEGASPEEKAGQLLARLREAKVI
jgi:electron transfer flavoprotein beta subunit